MNASSSGSDSVSLPDDLPVVERKTVRLIVVDKTESILLFHTRDRDHPDLGTWWEPPGGGIDAGETFLEAAIRELQEEAGIVVASSQVGSPTWRRSSTFRHRQTRHLQDEVVVTVRLQITGPPVDGSLRLDYEQEDYFGFRWWPRAEVVASDERFYPGQLPTLLDKHLRGEEIDEPFELWS